MSAVRVAAWIVTVEVALAATFGIAGATGNITGKANASTFDTHPEYSHATTCYIDVDGARHCLPSCDYEDGNPDGLPCVWVDTDTGDAYLNDGANYRSWFGTPRIDTTARVGGSMG